MSRPSTDRRRLSTETQHDDIRDADLVSLVRTRSQDPSAVESVAVQEPDSKSVSEAGGDSTTTWPQSTRYLVLLCAFITSLSFGVTQVPLLYVFRLMTCDAYYEDHPSQVHPRALGAEPILSYALARSNGSGTAESQARDRCSIHPIESSTALSISLLGASTTVFGIMNLFLTGSLIKRIGVKPTLLIQVFFPALRLVVQNIGIEVWGKIGIIIVQCSQVVSIIGGPSGYLLCLNTFMTEVVEYEGRTAALGRLTGSQMFGSALGFLLGGLVAEIFGIKAPFRLTMIVFLASCVYVATSLPHIPPAEAKAEGTGLKSKETRTIANKFLGPLSVFAPRKFIGRDGIIRTEYGAFLLAWGVFLGILATGYLPTLLQLYSTDVFAFGTKENGWLIFLYSMLRGVFLTFAFPLLIAIGRRWSAKREEQARETEVLKADSERQPLLGTTNGTTVTAQDEPKKEQTFRFDLTYTRFSLIADGLLTLLCSFVRQGWQMYLVAVILPFAAGTGSAAKGTILQMVGSSASSGERTDALAGVSLVENMARLSTSE
ncbi:hypothetical protein OHC33_002312 [Knufia fluminis]|uniref:MFS general substrate transporter n=1 Tax=Knufia fluminis TaxID=191047 RepID=A0AAN8I826_9EURO|nr:hypothetical protein OHC33_002312 [Knufia fluminis]